jgi:acyl-CoA synthetase (AMP-forming)/AMP-acid ligase II
MLTLNNRPEYATLLDAVTLSAADDKREAIIYVSSDQSTIRVSRAEFGQTIRRYAAALHHLGIRPGDLVVLAHTQNLESIYAFWGAMFAGAIPSMFPTLTEKLDPDIYMSSMAELARLSEVKAVLTADDFAQALEGRLPCPVYGSTRLAAAVNDNNAAHLAPHRPDPEQIAFLQHSSGTTGLQKGVALSHRAALNQLASYAVALELSKSDVVVSWLPLYHDMGLIAGFLLPLFQGLPLVLMSPFDWVRHPALLLRAIHDHGGTLCWLPNFAYNHCARRIRGRDLEGLSLASMRAFVNCSEPVRDDSHRLFLDRFAAHDLRPEMLSVSYAMAENTFAVTQTPPGRQPVLDIIDRIALEEDRAARPVTGDHEWALAMVSCGPPINGTEVRVIDDDGRALEERWVGQMAIRGDCMLSGYYKRPDLSPFQDGWYLTGDMGYLAGDQVYIVGRSKDLIINAGKNIYPQDVEAIVNKVPGVHAGRAVVFGVPDEREGTELIAVVAELKAPLSAADPDVRKRLNKAIRQEVARQSMITVSYVQLVDHKWLIKTSSGKIARAANRDKWLAQRQKNQTR